MAVKCSLATNTGIDYFKSLSVKDFFLIAEDIAEVLKERNEGG